MSTNSVPNSMREYFQQALDAASSALTQGMNYVSENVRDPETMVPLATATAVGVVTHRLLSRAAATTNVATTTAPKEIRHQDEEALEGLQALELCRKPVTTTSAWSGSAITYTKDEAKTIAQLNTLLNAAPGADTTALERIFKPLVDALNNSGAKQATSINIAPFNEADVKTLADLYTSFYQSQLPTGSNLAASLGQPEALRLIKQHIDERIATRTASEVSKWTKIRDGLTPFASSAAAKLSTAASYARSAASTAYARSASAASTASAWTSSAATKAAPHLPTRTTVFSIGAGALTWAGTSYAMSMRHEES